MVGGLQFKGTNFGKERRKVEKEEGILLLARHYKLHPPASIQMGYLLKNNPFFGVLPLGAGFG